MITSGVLLAVIAVIGAVLVGVIWFKLNGFERVDLNLGKADEGPVNFLMVGSDSRENVSPDDPDAGAFLDEAVSGQRTDTIMVVRVDAAANSISILSIPRDLWVPIAGTNETERINTAFAGGGAQRLIDTVSSVLQLEINHYVEIDFRGFKQLVETIGGVPMYFDAPLYDEYSGLLIPQAGCVKLDGTQALAFARARHLQFQNADGEWVDDPTADLGRITRQQLFLRKAMDKAATLGLGDVGRINHLIDVGTQNVKFDEGLGTSQLVSLIRKFSNTNGEGMHSYSLPTQAFETPEGASVLLLDNAAAQPTLDLFRGNGSTAAPATTSTTALTAEQVAITVLNGTGVKGQAREAADALGEAGFVVAKVGDAPTVGQTQTSLRFAPGHKAQADLVALIMQPGVKLVEDASAGNGVVLTTGADFRGITLPEATTTVAPPGPVATTTTVVGVAPPEAAPPGEACA